jgi:capsid protein
LLWSLTMGHLGALPIDGFDKFNAPAWQPRRWKSPDPVKDSQANSIDWGLRTRSLREIIRESGRDPDEVFEEIARDKSRLDELGIAPTLPGGLQFDTPEEAAEVA